MEVRTLKKALGIGLLTAMAALINPTAHAANADVTVDIDLPTVLVMYHFSTIDLDIAEAAMADYLTGGATVTCSGGGNCDDQGTTAAIPVTDLSNPIPVNVVDSGPGSGTVSVTLENAVGVRSFGCTTYTATQDEAGTSSAGINVPNQGISGIDTLGCQWAIRLGDLAFEMDLTTVGANPQAVINVDITGS